MFGLFRILAPGSVLGKEDLQQMLAEYINADRVTVGQMKNANAGPLTQGSELSDLSSPKKEKYQKLNVVDNEKTTPYFKMGKGSEQTILQSRYTKGQ